MSNSDIKCPKCGASVKGDSLYCNYCGSALTDVRDLLKKQAENEVYKDKINADLKLEKEKNSSMNATYIFLGIFSIVMLGFIFAMCYMATH